MMETEKEEIVEAQLASPFQQVVSLPKATTFPYAYAAAIAYAVCSAILVGALPDPGRGNFLSYVTIATLFGSLFGHTTSASIWSSLGTGYHWVRVTLCVAWLSLLVIAFLAIVVRENGPEGETTVIIGGTLLLQSLFIQVPLWTLRFAIGLRLVVRSNSTTNETERIQFGIGHMMIFTAIIALGLGAAQALIRLVGSGTSGPTSEWPIFLYLAAAAILTSLPVAVAALLDRHQVIALLVAMVFVAIVTGAEYPLMRALGLQRGGPDIYHVVSINLAVALIVLAYCLGLRLFGFRLTVGKNKANPIVNASPF